MEVILQQASERTEQMIVGIALVFEGEATEADVVEILEPFEVRHRHTAGVEVQVGNHQHVLPQQDLVGLQVTKVTNHCDVARKKAALVCLLTMLHH